jgi:hypothetical protein
MRIIWKKEGDQWEGGGREQEKVMGGKYEQSTLHTCMKMSQ